jgi:acyl-CoA dehydrogenase
MGAAKCKKHTMSGFQEYFGETHNMVRDTVRKFMEREIKPFVEEWEEQGEFARELYAKAGAAGILGIGYPEAHGGSGGDVFLKIAACEELMRCGSSGVVAGLGSLDISIPPILSLGTEEQKSRFVPPVLKGDRISALGITEPNAGSDVANIRTKAIRQGDHYVVNGGKMFITSGARANQLTCAVRTGGEGFKGVSLLVIESDTPGYSVSRKLGPRIQPRYSLTSARCLLKTFLGKRVRAFTASCRTFKTRGCNFP